MLSNIFALVGATVFAAFYLLPISAQAQATVPLVGSAGVAIPLEVTADDGIEWRQEDKFFIASGNAVATRGDIVVHSNLLRAHYRDAINGRTEIWRLDAEGSVTITAPNQIATGELGLFDIDNGVFVLSGGDVRYITPDSVIRADTQLEYWTDKQLAVARGNATTTRDDKTLRADVLSAHFGKGKDGSLRVHRIEAFDNVRIITAEETASSQRAVYDVVSGIAVLTGDVSITRGETQLKGCRADVNIDTGISRLRACGNGGGRVRGLISPNKSEAK
jgi:lipopolysaccharide export system protein LptA